MKLFNNLQLGQSILEVIIALAIFAMISATIASLSSGSFLGFEHGGEQTEAQLLAGEGIEAVRSIRDNAWNEVLFSTSSISANGARWILDGEGTTEIIGEYTRRISFKDVCRDVSDNITSCPGTYLDIHTKEVTSNISWQTGLGFSNAVTQTAYISNWDSREWTQTNWSGGSGQSLLSDETRFDTASSSIDTSTSGEIALGDAGVGTWSLSGGSEFIDTTDADFGQGTFNSTQIVGSGVSADLALTFGLTWIEHSDSNTTDQDLNAASIVTSTNIWAVGDSGKFFNFDGTNWTEVADLGGDNVNGVHMITASDGWAVGKSGKIWSYNGTLWNENTDTGNETWNDVDCTSTSNCWAVGNGGKLSLFDGSSWTESLIPSPGNLYSIHAISSSDIWVVGSSGRIWHFNGSSWSLYTDTGNEVWNAIECTSASNCWAAGNGGDVASYDGATWTESSLAETNNIYAIYSFASNNIRAATQNGIIWKYNGFSWSIEADTGNEDWNAIVMTSSSSGFALGNNGEIFHLSNAYSSSGTFESRIFDSGSAVTDWNIVLWTETITSGSDITISTRTGDTAIPDGSWSGWSSERTDETGSSILSPQGRYLQYRVTFTRGTNTSETPILSNITLIYGLATGEHLNALHIISPSDMWAVGENGVFLYYNGLAWILDTDTGNGAWNDVSCASSSECWSVGDGGAVAEYNGASWSESVVPSSANMFGVHAVSSNDVWASGASGRIWHFNGSSWSLYTDTGNEVWNAIECTSASNCWAAGNGGDVASYDGATWTESTISPSQNINGIDAISGSDYWSSGDDGNIWRNTGSWALHTDTGTENWNSIYMLDSNNGWVVGDGGIISNWNGSTWGSFLSPTTRNLNDVVFIDEDNGWAVGRVGTIIKFRGSSMETLGYLTSSAFDMGDSSPVQIIEWDQVMPVCTPTCSVRLQIQSAPDSGGIPGVWSSTWSGPDGEDGDETDFYTTSRGELINLDHNGDQWIRYRAELIGDSVKTPVLEEVRINYK